MGKGLALNNPYHLRATSIAWRGESTRAGDEFERFEKLEDGVRSGVKNLLNQQRLHGLRTPYAIISRYAPPSDRNPTADYAAYFAQQVGAKDAFTPIDLENPETLTKAAAAIWKFEGSGIPLSLATIGRAVADLLGIPT